MFFKNKTFVLMFLSLFLLTSKNTFANTCKLSNGFEVLNCALEKSPDLLRAKAQEPAYAQYQKQSKKWFNPELDGGVNYTKSDDEKGIEVELAVLQNIENPNKRKARINRAGAELQNSILNTLEQEQKTSYEILTTLNRLRQISKEKNVINEAVATYQKVLNKYNSLSALSPEDEVSKDVFDIALKNYKVEYQQLLNEEVSYKSYLKTMLSLKTSSQVKNSWFLYPPKSWPKLTAQTVDVNNSLTLAKEKNEVDIAKANYQEAQAGNFSGVNVGPYIATKPNNLGELDTYGIKFSFPIPINANKNGIKGANYALKAAEQSHKLRSAELEQNAATLIQTYNAGIKTLRGINLYSLENRHKKIEQLFATGRVSASLFIEAHEQLIETTKTYNAYELETLQSLWTIYSLNRDLITKYKEVANAK